MENQTDVLLSDTVRNLLTKTGAVHFSLSKALESIEPINGTNFELQELYKLIECRLVQIVPLDQLSEAMGEPYILIVDEEGKLRNDARERLNIVPSILCFPAGRDWVAGNAIICKDKFVK